MASQYSPQGTDERAADGVAFGDRDDTQAERAVGDLEAALDRTDRRLGEIVEQYERSLETYERLRRETDTSETFVWTGDERESQRLVAIIEGLRHRESN